MKKLTSKEILRRRLLKSPYLKSLEDSKEMVSLLVDEKMDWQIPHMCQVERKYRNGIQEALECIEREAWEDVKVILRNLL